MFKLTRFATAGFIALLGGCAVGPNYRRPDGVDGVPVPTQFSNAVEPGFATGVVEVRFWEAFKDPTLDQLITAALAANNDLKIAVANLNAARADRRSIAYDLFPTVTATSDYKKGMESQNELPGYSRDQRRATDIDAGFDALWELDLFGRVRREVEAARADEQSVQANLRAAQVSVTAEVARDYFVLRGLQDQLAVATRNADNQLKSLQLTQVRFEAGRGTDLDTARAEAQLKTTLATIPPLQASIATTIYTLSVLLGRAPDALTAQLSSPQAIPELPPLNNIGTPETLLRRRPDVQVAERRLAGATARIGVAVGDMFPKVTFVGAVGYNANTVGGLGSGGSEAYAYGPGITWAAFDLGRVAARIHASRANADAALAAYQKTVLAALQEAESALVIYARAQSRTATLKEAAAASDKAARLAHQRYESGLTDFLNVLDAERDALNAETSLTASRTETATDLIAVYKALGGAWQGLGDVVSVKTANSAMSP